MSKFARMLAGILLFAVGLTVSTPASSAPNAGDTMINAVIGDRSWHETEGSDPSTADEVARIRTHLRYVISQLAAADVGRLSADQRARRAAAIEALSVYTTAGVFPRRASNDGYGARRPRFIDDRGVHCAVGELIRVSGDGPLAREIAREWEYAYVVDIESDELAEWAERHGFTARELATIQPTYGMPPSKQSVEARARDARDSLTWLCGRDHPIVPTVKLRLEGDEHGRVSVSSVGDDPFSHCFVDRLRASGLDGGAWDTQPKPFRSTLKLRITSPQELLTARLNRVDLQNKGCVPRPGPLVTSATVRLIANEREMNVEVLTEPANDEVRICLATAIAAAFRDVGAGHWNIDATVRKPLERTVNTARLKQVLPMYLTASANGCRAHGAPKSLQAKVDAKADAERFAVALSGGGEAFRTCVQAELRRRLRSDFSVSRKLASGEYERYFRIDGSASAEITITVGSSEQKPRPKRGGRNDDLGF